MGVAGEGEDLVRAGECRKGLRHAPCPLRVEVGQDLVHHHGKVCRQFGDARGIWGVWELSPGCTGGFRIWPKGLEVAESMETSEEAPVELPAALRVRMLSLQVKRART